MNRENFLKAIKYEILTPRFLHYSEEPIFGRVVRAKTIKYVATLTDLYFYLVYRKIQKIKRYFRKVLSDELVWLKEKVWKYYMVEVVYITDGCFGFTMYFYNLNNRFDVRTVSVVISFAKFDDFDELCSRFLKGHNLDDYEQFLEYIKKLYEEGILRKVY